MRNLTRLPLTLPVCIWTPAGNAAFHKALHSHCTALKFSSSIGGTHVSELGGSRAVAGPKPTLFFAPAQIKKRSTEWGPQGLGQRLVQSWQAFMQAVANPTQPWLNVQRHKGSDAVQAAYLQVLEGKGVARVGHMLSL